MRLHAAESNVLTTADDGLRLGEGTEFVAKREGAVKRGPEAGGTITLKTAVEDSLSAQVLCLQAVTDTAVVTKLVKGEAVANSMDSSACGRPLRSTAVFRITAMEETRGMGGKPSSGVTGNLSFE